MKEFKSVKELNRYQELLTFILHHRICKSCAKNFDAIQAGFR